MANKAPKNANGNADEVKVLARNRRARHEYHVDETLEAGVVLAGSEVKSIRAGKATLVDAFADIDRGEAWLHQVDIGVYPFAHGRNHDPRRKRKLLLHRREIDRLAGKIREKGYTLRAAEPVREEGARESRAGAGARQAAVGQARGFEEARVPARDRPSDVGAPVVAASARKPALTPALSRGRERMTAEGGRFDCPVRGARGGRGAPVAPHGASYGRCRQPDVEGHPRRNRGRRCRRIETLA